MEAPTEKQDPRKDAPSDAQGEKPKRGKLAVELGLTEQATRDVDAIFRRLRLEKERDDIEGAMLATLQGKKFPKAIISADGAPVERILQAVDELSVHIIGQKDWSVSRLTLQNAADGDAMKGVNVIVHPLYGLLRGEQWDPALWKESKGRLDVYVERSLVAAATKAAAALRHNPKAIPEAYLFVMEAVQELEAMKTLAAQKDRLSVFVMPRRSLLMPQQQEAMQQFLEPYKDQKNIRVVDSLDDGTGALPTKVQEALGRAMPLEGPVRLQGGYWMGCLDSCLKSIQEVGRKDIQLSVDFDAATYFHRPLDGDVRETLVLGKTSTIVPPANAFGTVADVMEWVRRNKDFNGDYKKTIMPKYKESLPKGVDVTRLEGDATMRNDRERT
jgi:hypothetical protein